MSALDDTLAALSDPTRRAVVDLLRKRPRRAGELSEATGSTPPAMSRHLRILRTRGLIEEDHDGEDARVRVYRLRRAPFESLRRWIEDVEGFWASELAAFARHAEKGGPKGSGRR